MVIALIPWKNNKKIIYGALCISFDYSNHFLCIHAQYFFLLRKNWKLGGKSGVAGEELEGREWG